MRSKNRMEETRRAKKDHDKPNQARRNKKMQEETMRPKKSHVDTRKGKTRKRSTGTVLLAGMVHLYRIVRNRKKLITPLDISMFKSKLIINKELFFIKSPQGRFTKYIF